ncbi:macrophage mannose receptor 1-like isoform X2 [Tachysurus vachellii]|uniref:macrophage mannose receptor 1-like isoform X2 n=1 Tax=Tachysurus vachellii TaxID=175792 RepID=UPI00296AE848|nr:macrophage mannose receptor 1-like isoform X2 [Tachysurus vachellii]
MDPELKTSNSMAGCQRREYVYIDKKMTWFSAQSYCRENYVDLATVTSDEENQRLVLKASSLSFAAWIGLNKTVPNGNVWQWSDGETPNNFMWVKNQPDNYNHEEDCVMIILDGWNDVKCVTYWPFFCYWRFVLVKEYMTWKEALDYCRTYYTGLASPISENQLSLARTATTGTQNVSIWTGLRFVNGRWVSVSSTPLGNLVSLPSCPVPRYRCGARNTNTNLWENRDCDEKLNFLCY